MSNNNQITSAVGCDVGTMFFQTGKRSEANQIEYTTTRNAFIELSKTDDISDVLAKNKFKYVEDDKNVYIIGEDAIRFARMLPGKVELRRPLANGVLNREEEMKNSVLNELIKSSIGRAPNRQSVACTCVSSKPVDGSPDNTFHEKRLKGMFENQGWNVLVVEEALAVIVSEQPSTVDKDGNELPFTGIGISFGAGRVNMVLTLKGVVGVGISAGRSGDWIDREVSEQLNIPIAQVTSFKETKLDFDNIDDESDLQFGLDAYYGEMLKYVFNKFAEQFKASKDTEKYDFPLDIVIAGGTSTVKGFIGKAERIIRNLELPFEVRDVRHAKDPRNAVVNGLLLRAENEVKKMSKKDSVEDILK